eukprot:Selendium_serpulae@DN2429_c0_g1_i1.p1
MGTVDGRGSNRSTIIALGRYGRSVSKLALLNRAANAATHTPPFVLVGRLHCLRKDQVMNRVFAENWAYVSFYSQAVKLARFNIVMHQKLRLATDLIGFDIGAIKNHLPNSSLRVLDLSGNDIWDGHLEDVCEALAKNSGLQTLDLSDNDIRSDGAKAIGAALVTNQALRSLNLSGNKIGADGATAIAEALTRSEALRDLNVSGNEVGDAGALAVGAALQTNSALQLLDLSNNSIFCFGATAIADALKTNSGLLYLNLSQNQIFAEGTNALGAALLTNTTLQTLDLGWFKATGTALRQPENIEVFLETLGGYFD